LRHYIVKEYNNFFKKKIKINNMFKFTLLIAAILLVLIDSIYLNLMKKYISNVITKVQGPNLKFNYISALICYIFLITGLSYFILIPRKSVQDAFLLGIVIYGVYESTTYALFQNWSLIVAIIDTLWGGILFALVTYLIKLLQKFNVR